MGPSVPSATLLRFLRSQSGFVAGAPACVRPQVRALSQEAVKTGPPRRSSSWARSGKSKACLSLDAGLFNIPDSRPRPSVPSLISEQLIFTRHASTTRRPFLKRLFDFKRTKTAEFQKARNLGPTLIDDGDGIFNIGRGLAAKASNELRIRCTEFDMNGNVTLVNGEFRKSELIAKVSIFELQVLDLSFC
jgi:magnesium transporter